MDYGLVRRRLLGVAFVAGPVLMVTSALALVANVGRNPGAMSWGSSAEGLIGFFGFVLLVPVFLALADLVGQRRVWLGTAGLVVVLFGFAGGGVAQMVLRVAVPDLVAAGMTEPMLQELYASFESGSALLVVLIAMGPLIGVGSILVGIGLLLTPNFRLNGGLLVLAGVALPAGQLFLFLTEFMYSLALLLWAVALVPLGWGMLNGRDVIASAR